MDQKNKNLLSNHKEEAVTLLVALICLVLFAFFPTSGALQKITSALFFLFVVPVLYIKLILKKNLDSFGWSLGDCRAGIFWGLSMLVVTIICTYGLIRFTNFTKDFQLPFLVTQNFWMFILYELGLMNILFFLQEFFFKGFVLLGFAKKFGFWSVIISFLLFLAMSLLGNGSLSAMAPAIIFSLTGGLIVYKSKTIIYSYASGLLFSLILSSYLIYLSKAL